MGYKTMNKGTEGGPGHRVAGLSRASTSCRNKWLGTGREQESGGRGKGELNRRHTGGLGRVGCFHVRTIWEQQGTQRRYPPSHLHRASPQNPACPSFQREALPLQQWRTFRMLGAESCISDLSVVSQAAHPNTFLGPTPHSTHFLFLHPVSRVPQTPSSVWTENMGEGNRSWLSGHQQVESDPSLISG